MKHRTATAAPKDTKRCAIYTRKSTSAGLEQEFNSLDAQREACVSYVQRQLNWTLLETHYNDGGFTGANIDRPAFQRLLGDVEAGLIDVIVVYKVDRLSRSLLDFAKVMERLNTAGASFVSVTQNFSTADAMGRLTLNMLMSFAEFEREMIADRTRDKVAAARRKGKWTGGHVPFGYSLEDKHLVVNELEARIVREAFDLLIQHRQMAAVSRLLNERKLLPCGARLPSGKHPVWTREGIRRLLHSPLYAGFITAGEDLHKGEHPAIVTEEVFHRAQAILAGSERELQHGGINHDYFLRGLLHCGQCGAALTPSSTTKAKAQYRYYRCSTRNRVATGEGSCTAAPLAAGAIESYVVERIKACITDGSFSAEATNALDARLQQRRTDLLAARDLLPGRIATLSANASRLADELTRVDGKGRAIVEARLNTEAEKLAAAEKELAGIQADLAALDGAEADAAWVRSVLADFTPVWEALTIPNRGRLLRALLEKVVVDEANDRIELHLVDLSPNMPTIEAA